MRILTFIMLSLVASKALASASHLNINWSDDPLAIELKKGVEQRIDFPEPIQDLQIPDEMNAVFKINLSAKGILHILVSENVKAQRLYATSSSGQVYILDLSANSEYAEKRISIADSSLPSKTTVTGPAIPDFLKTQNTESNQAIVEYVAFARFAMAHHLGSARLIPDFNATRVPLGAIDLARFVRLNSGVNVTALNQWKARNFYITSVLAENNSEIDYEFDPRGFRGSFLFAATANLVLDRNNPKTIWVFVSKQPFSIAARGI